MKPIIVMFLITAALPCGATAEHLLEPYEADPQLFEQIAIGDKTVFFRTRHIGDALVEKDFIVYQFDKQTKELIAKKSHWRDDLPDRLPPLGIAREEAERLAGGAVQSTRLCIISPESDVFPISPVPANPCWIVTSMDRERVKLTVIDAVEGAILGYGVSPPYTGFSITGPTDFGPCSGGWNSWYLNARNWFITMGYSAEAVYWPTEAKFKSHVKSGQTAVIYEIAHGGSYSFSSGCIGGQSAEETGSYEVHYWIRNFAKVPFTFVASCEGLCDTGSGTFSYEFRKGSYDSTVTVGYCGMSESYCEQCWWVSLDWQDALFDYMSQGWTVKAAFDQANADYPVCPAGGCMRFAGDESFTVVPVVQRDPWPPVVTVLEPNGGEVFEYGTDREIRWGAIDNARVWITILLSMDSGLTFPDTLVSGEVNDSSYIWTVPDLDSKTARIKIVAADDAENESSDVSDTDFTLWGSTSGVGSGKFTGVPHEELLHVASGNPSSSGWDIVFGLPVSGTVRVGVYGVTGRLVRKLAEGSRTQGYHVVSWDGTGEPGRRLSPGIYFVRLESQESQRTAKIVLAN